MPTELVDDRRLRLLAGVLLLGATVSLLDTTIVSVALDTIAAQTDASEAEVGWVSSSYLLAMAVVIPLMGWAVDRFGARTVWLATLTVFALGSLLCALAWSTPSLVAFRVLQGAGGGLILPLCQAILTQAAGPERIARALALITIPGQLVPVAGPALGGLLVSGLGWRSIFWINLPICAVALLAAWRLLPDGERRTGLRLDWLGALLLSAALGGLIYTLSVGGEVQWLPAGAGVVLLALFVVHGLRTAEPIVDLRLFARRGFGPAAILLFLSGVAIFGALYLLPLYYQQIRLHTPFEAGLLLAPQGVGTALALLAGSRYVDRAAPAPLVVAGTLAALAGSVPFLFVTAEPDSVLLAAAMVVRGFGLGLAGLAMTAAAYRLLARPEIPRATALISVLQRLGGAAGTAVLALVLATQPAGEVDAFAIAFQWSAGLVAICLLPALALPFRRAEAPSPPATSR
ncbi:DHA2 family efflux MFS transporter permease subunit [Amycolatopsis sp. cmx-11-51]|uniref:DHA2 family efflux MFS transporter permease subunit n=1 Tax=Amycolatopsis sp. cmx-11-51 TaxID=2785797 RepID=UPI0039E4D027